MSKWKYEGVRQEGTDWEFTNGDPCKLFVVSFWDGKWYGTVATSVDPQSEFNGAEPLTDKVVKKLRALIPEADLK